MQVVRSTEPIVKPSLLGSLALPPAPPARQESLPDRAAEPDEQYNHVIGDDVYDLTRIAKEVLHRDEFIPSDTELPRHMSRDLRHWLAAYRDFLTDYFDPEDSNGD